jgi:hypothetical protein
MYFIQANDKLVNLEHVSSINLLGNRMALDLDTPVELDSGKIISYYAYSDYTVENDASGCKANILANEYVKENFIISNNTLININHIAAIKQVDKTLRVIFNLSHSVTSTGFNNESKLTSKFIYVDFNDSSKYSEFIEYTKSKIGM